VELGGNTSKKLTLLDADDVIDVDVPIALNV